MTLRDLLLSVTQTTRFFSFMHQKYYRIIQMFYEQIPQCFDSALDYRTDSDVLNTNV